MGVLIRGGRLVTAVDSYEASILVEDGRISQVGRALDAPPGGEVYDATGKLVMPGVVDVHVHVGLNLKGHLSSDFLSTTRAAAFGGVTTILTYATPRAEERLSEAVGRRREEAESACYIDYGLHACLVNWDDRTDDEIPEMIESGIPSFKMYTAYSSEGWRTDDRKMYEVFHLVNRHSGLIEVHCESEWIIERKTRRMVQERTLTPGDHAASRPSYVEGEAVGGVLRTACDAGSPVYIVHVSTAEAVEALLEAEDLGLEIYAETCPHFLLLGEEKLAGKNGQRYATCPPLRAKEHAPFLWEGLNEGSIQVVATDHCEFMAADKDEGADDFRKLPMGLPGVGTLLPLMWHFGVRGGRMTENELVDRLSTQPCEIFGLHPRKGVLAPGSDADLVVFDTDREVTITAELLRGYSDYSPYDGWQVRGWPVSTMVRGDWVVKDGELVGSPEHGCFVERGSVCQRPGKRSA